MSDSIQPKKSLASIFNQSILPAVEYLEGLRKMSIYLFAASVIPFGIFVGVFIAIKVPDIDLPWSHLSESDLGTYAFFSLTLFLILAGFAAYQFRKYKHEFKVFVITPIIKTLYPDLVYIPKAHISEQIYHECGLCSTHYNRFGGDDYINGTIDGVGIQFSDLKVTRRERVTDSKGRTRYKTVNVFTGLLFKCDFNKKIDGETYIRPDFAEKLLGKFGRSFQGAFKKDKMVHLENIDFEKNFTVESTCQIEARYILTPQIMERILAIYQSFGVPLSMSFKGQSLYMTLAGFDMFEASLFKKSIEFDQIKSFQNALDSLMGVVQQMKLNDKIFQ